MISNGFKNRLSSVFKPKIVNNFIHHRKQNLCRPNSTKANNDDINLLHQPIHLKDGSKNILEMRWDNKTRIFTKPNDNKITDQAPFKYESKTLIRETESNKLEKTPPPPRKRAPPIESTARKADSLIDGLNIDDDNGEIYMFLALLREGLVDRAKHLLLWKLMKNDPPLRNDVLETCLSGILAQWDETDLTGLLEILENYMENLPPTDQKVAPSRCIAYILHCACISKDSKTGNKIIAEVNNYWTHNYNQTMRNILRHQDILTEYDIQRIKNVSMD